MSLILPNRDTLFELAQHCMEAVYLAVAITDCPRLEELIPHAYQQAKIWVDKLNTFAGYQELVATAVTNVNSAEEKEDVEYLKTAFDNLCMYYDKLVDEDDDHEHELEHEEYCTACKKVITLYNLYCLYNKHKETVEEAGKLPFNSGENRIFDMVEDMIREKAIPESIRELYNKIKTYELLPVEVEDELAEMLYDGINELNDGGAQRDYDLMILLLTLIDIDGIASLSFDEQSELFHVTFAKGWDKSGLVKLSEIEEIEFHRAADSDDLIIDAWKHAPQMTFYKVDLDLDTGDVKVENADGNQPEIIDKLIDVLSLARKPKTDDVDLRLEPQPESNEKLNTLIQEAMAPPEYEDPVFPRSIEELHEYYTVNPPRKTIEVKPEPIRIMDASNPDSPVIHSTLQFSIPGEEDIDPEKVKDIIDQNLICEIKWTEQMKEGTGLAEKTKYALSEDRAEPALAWTDKPFDVVNTHTLNLQESFFDEGGIINVKNKEGKILYLITKTGKHLTDLGEKEVLGLEEGWEKNFEPMNKEKHKEIDLDNIYTTEDGLMYYYTESEEKEPDFMPKQITHVESNPDKNNFRIYFVDEAFSISNFRDMDSTIRKSLEWMSDVCSEGLEADAYFALLPKTMADAVVQCQKLDNPGPYKVLLQNEYDKLIETQEAFSATEVHKDCLKTELADAYKSLGKAEDEIKHLNEIIENQKKLIEAHALFERTVESHEPADASKCDECACKCEPENTPDPINPDYYNSNGCSCIEAMSSFLNEDEMDGFCKGSAFKYIWRAGNKPGNSFEQDMAKAQWYLDLLAEDF